MIIMINIMYTGNDYVFKGIVLSTLSILKHTNEEVHVYLVTMDIDSFKGISSEMANKLDTILKEKNKVLKDDLNKVSSSSVKTLLKKGIIIESEEEAYRYNIEKNEKHDFSLNNDQMIVFNRVNASIDENEVFFFINFELNFGSFNFNTFNMISKPLFNPFKA